MNDDDGPDSGSYSRFSNPFPGIADWVRAGRLRWLVVVAVGVVFVALAAWRSL